MCICFIFLKGQRYKLEALAELAQEAQREERSRGSERCRLRNTQTGEDTRTRARSGGDKATK